MLADSSGTKRLWSLWDGIALLRPTLLLPLWIMQLLGRLHAEERPLSGWPEPETWGLNARFWAWCGAHTLMAGAAYVLNQLTDLKTDAINRKLFLLADGYVGRSFAFWAMAICLTLAGGLLLAVPPSLPALVLLGLSVLLGAIYSLPPIRLKARAGWDLLANAIGYGVVSFLLGWTTARPVSILALWESLPYAFCVGGTFLFTTIPDREGDRLAGCRTTGVVLGPRWTGLLGWSCYGGAALLGLLGENWRATLAATTALLLYAPGLRTLWQERDDPLLVRRTQLGILALLFVTGWGYPPLLLWTALVIFWVRWVLPPAARAPLPVTGRIHTMWEVLNGIAWTAAGFYLLMSLGVAVGIELSRRQRRREEGPPPFVSVLVAARNEEENLERCLRSLLSQDYPSDRYEVILINDRSTDRTGEIAERIAQEDPRLRVVAITALSEGWTGKHQALHRGVQAARGEVLLMTDADGGAPPRWARAMVTRLGSEAGLVFGPSVMDRTKRSLWTRLQSLEMLTLVGSAAAAVVWGFPSACSGHNLAVRRKTLEEIGGYPALGYTLTEDTALLQAVRRRTRWKIRSVLDPEALLWTEPAPHLKALLQQRRRWLLGGRAARVPAMGFLRAIFGYHLGLWVLALLALTTSQVWKPFSPFKRGQGFRRRPGRLASDGQRTPDRPAPAAPGLLALSPPLYNSAGR
ncbi:MAG: hypothetical protein KatS3mg115_1321 [Candidatus Poribacteria bacterium]|nr:MAG: hypothetical protein KatS3mg115_1321 [Candidatus Poribacteria bacterium]